MRHAIIASAAAVVVGSAAHAQLQVFFDRASWEAAVAAPIFNQDFNSAPVGVIGDGATLDLGNLEITRDGSPNAADGLLEIEPGANFGNVDGSTFISGETGADPHEIVNVTFDGASVFAFGADWFSPFSGDGIGLLVAGELVLLDSISGFDIGFVGVIADESFNSVQIVGNPDTPSFQELWSADNFAYAVIPAPGAIALAGLAGMTAARRRR